MTPAAFPLGIAYLYNFVGRRNLVLRSHHTSSRVGDNLAGAHAVPHLDPPPSCPSLRREAVQSHLVAQTRWPGNLFIVLFT